MSAVNPIKLAVLNTEELSTLASGAVDTLLHMAGTHPHIHVTLREMRESLIAITKVQNIPTGDELLEEIKAIESEMFDSLKLVCEILTINIGKAGYAPGKAGASGTLMEILCQKSCSLFEEKDMTTPDVCALVKDIFRDNLSAIRANADVGPILETVRLQSEVLEEYYHAHENDGVGKTKIDTHTSVLEFHLDSLLGYIQENTSKQVDGFVEVVSPLNDIISEVQQQYHSRLGNN